MKKRTEQIHEQLFREQGSQVWTILDGASIPNLLDSLETHQPKHICLYRGELDPELAATAPYLVMLTPNSAMTNWILNGFGNHWGVFAVTMAEMKELRRHFRKFLMVYDPDGKPLYFRYYDPRVLRDYLPTCNGEETQAVFGPVSAYYAEGEEENTLIRFDPQHDKVVTTKIPIDNHDN